MNFPLGWPSFRGELFVSGRGFCPAFFVLSLFFGKDTVFQIGFPVFVGCEKTSHVAWSLFLSVIGTVLFSSYQSCETPHLNLDG